MFSTQPTAYAETLQPEMFYEVIRYQKAWLLAYFMNDYY